MISMTDSCHVWIVMIQAGGANENRSTDWYFVGSFAEGEMHRSGAGGEV